MGELIFRTEHYRVGRRIFMSSPSEARSILSRALKELDEGARLNDSLKIRDACEKGWLATVKSVENFLMAKGFKPPETHVKRRRTLRELEKMESKMRVLGILDRVEARRSMLHADGFYSGILSSDEVKEELDKVEKLISDIESLAISG